MEKAIVKDIFFLQQLSERASREDLYLAQDLQDTLQANRENCIGLAANMIGVRKRVIIFLYGLVPVVMFNPVLLSKSGPYKTEEGCLSLVGSRPTQRYQENGRSGGSGELRDGNRLRAVRRCGTDH